MNPGVNKEIHVFLIVTLIKSTWIKLWKILF